MSAGAPSPPCLPGPSCAVVGEQLRRPLMGTETVAPLLYSLVRLQRPRRVLEVGAGYSTLFLAQALHDNRAAHRRELEQMRAKCERLERDDPARADRMRRWLEHAPPLGAPSHYAEPYAPQLVVVDDLSGVDSPAALARDVVTAQDFDVDLQFLETSCQDLPAHVLDRERTFDMIWVDCDQTVTVFDRCWGSLDPRGGLFIVHSLLSDRGGREVLEYMLHTLDSMTNETAELLNLVERHKVAQNGVTILRRTTEASEHVFDAEAVLAEAARLLVGRR